MQREGFQVPSDANLKGKWNMLAEQWFTNKKTEYMSRCHSLLSNWPHQSCPKSPSVYISLLTNILKCNVSTTMLHSAMYTWWTGDINGNVVIALGGRSSCFHRGLVNLQWATACYFAEWHWVVAAFQFRITAFFFGGNPDISSISLLNRLRT